MYVRTYIRTYVCMYCTVQTHSFVQPQSLSSHIQSLVHLRIQNQVGSHQHEHTKLISFTTIACREKRNSIKVQALAQKSTGEVSQLFVPVDDSKYSPNTHTCTIHTHRIHYTHTYMRLTLRTLTHPILQFPKPVCQVLLLVLAPTHPLGVFKGSQVTTSVTRGVTDSMMTMVTSVVANSIVNGGFPQCCNHFQNHVHVLPWIQICNTVTFYLQYRFVSYWVREEVMICEATVRQQPPPWSGDRGYDKRASYVHT